MSSYASPSTARTSRVRFRDLLIQMRPAHWAKNVLVLVPLLTSQQFFSLALWPSVLATFASFCLAASAAYQLNDLIDLESDRLHEQKGRRPLASGRLSPRTVAFFGIALAVGAGALALLANLKVAAIAALYVTLSALYSAVLKRIAVADVLALAALYCGRIFAGAAAIDVIVSPYLLAFSLFFFLSLALMKRYVALAANGGNGAPARTPYRKQDSTFLLMIGIAAALASSLLLGLYINDASIRIRFSSPDLLWGVLLALLYAVLRGWLAATRGRLDEDLANAAIRDPVLLAIGAAVVVLFLFAY